MFLKRSLKLLTINCHICRKYRIPLKILNNSIGGPRKDKLFAVRTDGLCKTQCFRFAINLHYKIRTKAEPCWCTLISLRTALRWYIPTLPPASSLIYTQCCSHGAVMQPALQQCVPHPSPNVIHFILPSFSIILFTLHFFEDLNGEYILHNRIRRDLRRAISENDYLSTR